VPVVSRSTFYGRAGFLFPWVAAAALIAFVAWAVVRRERQE